IPLNSGQASDIGFNVGNRNRPFLISSPPYGGGGYIMVTARGDTSTVSFGFSFGAVLSYTFGPLSAHGRVSVSLWVDKSGVGGSFEALGEGSVGCFGICVYLQVRLEPRGDQFIGTAEFSFSFRVGFISIEFHVRVQYAL